MLADSTHLAQSVLYEPDENPVIPEFLKLSGGLTIGGGGGGGGELVVSTPGVGGFPPLPGRGPFLTSGGSSLTISTWSCTVSTTVNVSCTLTYLMAQSYNPRQCFIW